MPSIGQTWVLASIGAVVEYIETTAYGVYIITGNPSWGTFTNIEENPAAYRAYCPD
jgi:hypothetical protein